MDAPLKFGGQAVAQLEPHRPEDSFAIAELIEQLVGFVRRQFPIFIFITACSVALGLVYLVTTPPSFTSHAMLLIDSSKLRILQQQQSPIGDVPIDTAQVETQVEILKSENIGLSVVKELKLTEDPEFVGSGTGLLGWLFERISPGAGRSESQLERSALQAFLAKRSITRVARTYVLDIGFTSLNPARSAAIANAIADAYIVDQLEAKYQATKRASVWLQDRIKELRQQASDADRAVLDYKEKNKIVAVGGTSATGGPRLLGEQQLEDLNTQLGTARAAAEEAKARLQRINEVMQKDVPDATVADSLRNEVINRLRNNYLDLAAREAIWSARYGSTHLAAVNLRTQMAEMRRSIHDELGRIAESYKSDFEITKTRVAGLEGELQKLVASSQITNRDRLGLTDLESTAKVYHSIYDSFLQRYMEAIQQQSFPITEARVISAAAPPERKSSPLGYFVLGTAALIGLVLSFGIAIMREAIDQVFRTTRQVESFLRFSCLAVLPRLSVPEKSREKKGAEVALPVSANNALGAADSRSGYSAHEPALARMSVETGSLKMPRAGGPLASNREITNSGSTNSSDSAEGRRLRLSNRAPLLRQVVDDPLSPFAEAFRSIKIAADIRGSGRINQVIGITSTLPGEGKSTVASNLAELMAHSGKRVILLDGDLRNPTLTRLMSPHAKSGVLEVLSGRTTLAEAIFVDEQTGLSFLPAVLTSRVVHTNEVLASSALKDLVESLRKTHDYVIIDFAPLAPVVDVRATTDLVDCYIYVIEWGRTRKNLVQQHLLSAPELCDRLLGVVLNKADVRVMGRYENYDGTYYYGGKYYGRYGHSAQ
jgi:polysaccharide biosynthesis transport protein